jgi:hypothetical protein
MSSDLKVAKQALRKALKKLHRGDHQAAQTWAQRAVELAPGLEEAWLVLACVSEPPLSLEYIKEALKINPESIGARQCLSELQQRLEEASQEPAPQTPQPQHVSSRHKNRPALLAWLRLFPVYGLAIFCIAIIVRLIFQSGIVNAHAPISGDQILVHLKPMIASVSTITPQAMDTNPTMLLPMATPSLTPLPLDTPALIPADPSDPTAASNPDPAPALSLADTSALGSSTSSMPASATGDKRILVNISEQHLYAFLGEELVFNFLVSTGTDNSTRAGSFSILDKIPDAYSDLWGYWMPDWLGIYSLDGINYGLHALPVLPDGDVIWGDALGAPISRGCVVMSPENALSLFEWADIGTRVEILP